MPQKIDLTGQRFDRLVVTRPAPNKVLKNGAVRTCWYCDCDCGTKDCVKETTYLRGNNKTTPKIKSCGCYTKEAHYLSHKKFNKYDLSGEYGIGYTSKGEEFYFDLEDYDKIKDFSWHISHGYVISQRTREERLRMHRFLFDDLPDDILIDHINGKRYDNRKANLRRVTIQQNNMNTDKTGPSKLPVTQTLVLPISKVIQAGESITLSIIGKIKLLNARGELSEKSTQAYTDEQIKLRIRQTSIAYSLAWIVQ